MKASSSHERSHVRTSTPSHLTLSVIIPTLNEAGRIEQTLTSVEAQPHVSEVIVVDGGSTDGTRERTSGRATVLQSPPGRARQMNAGAARATGDVLLFLHADTLLPAGATSAVGAALADPAVEAGLFRLGFDRETPLLCFYSFCTRLPSPLLGFGDRGLFVRRRVFEALSGFPPIPIFEDLEMTRRLHRRGGLRFLPQPVTTSARRFARHGMLRQQLRNAYLWLHWLAGTDPKRVAHLYRYDGREA